jgi:hypothetical protein
MFWFAGLVGMGLESKTIRNWLSSATRKSPNLSQEALAEPPSYMASFNPFPALVIGVTGAAMAAHHQRYLFQVRPFSLSSLSLPLFFLRLECFFRPFLNGRFKSTPFGETSS